MSSKEWWLGYAFILSAMKRLLPPRAFQKHLIAPEKHPVVFFFTTPQKYCSRLFRLRCFFVSHWQALLYWLRTQHQTPRLTISFRVMPHHSAYIHKSICGISNECKSIINSWIFELRPVFPLLDFLKYLNLNVLSSWSDFPSRPLPLPPSLPPPPIPSYLILTPSVPHICLPLIYSTCLCVGVSVCCIEQLNHISNRICYVSFQAEPRTPTDVDLWNDDNSTK